MSDQRVEERLAGGRVVERLRIGREPGVVVEVMTLGATVTRLWVTGGDGVRRNVVLGHATAEDYLAGTDFLGATVGRYANRIAGGRFTLDGAEVRLATNDRGNTLHGGPDGFHARVWRVVERDEGRVVMAVASPDGDQGFPGRLAATVAYAVHDEEVAVTFGATTDVPTVVNLTQHSYLNLDGEGGTVDDHRLEVWAEEFLPVDATGVPLADRAAVAGTPFDLRRPTRLGDAVRGAHEQIRDAGGIDHNYVLTGEGVRAVATLLSPRSRTRVDLLTDQPGLQVYTGNVLSARRPSTTGRRHRPGDGVALEPQLFPDTPNRPDFGSAVLRPGETYRSEMAWRFSATPPMAPE